MATTNKETLDIGLSPTAPPPIPAGWTAVQVEAYRLRPYGEQEDWKVGVKFYGQTRTLDDAISLAFEHVLFRIGLENCGVDIVLERGDDEARITYSGIQDKWQVELPE